MNQIAKRHLNGPRWVSPESLNVAPPLIGVPLARPIRRAWAMLVDCALIALLSGVSGFWLLGGLVLVLLQLRSQRGAATPRRMVVGWLGAGLLALLALQEVRARWHERSDPVASAAAAARLAADAAAEAADEAANAATDATAAAKEKREAARQLAAAALRVMATAAPAAAASASAAPAPTAAASTAAASAGLSDRERIAQLERELAAQRARPSSATSWRKEFSHALDAVGLKFGWAFVYFSLLPAWWGGQTVGKKIFGLRVVELTGKPMTVMRCLKRYGGYAAGMATGGLGFLQMLWDPNRQALQDKAAHTAVVDLRAPRQPLLAQTEAEPAATATRTLPPPPASVAAPQETNPAG